MNKIIRIAAYQLDPSLRNKSEAEQTAAFTETAALLWLLPFTVIGAWWLLAATDTAVLQQAWPMLLLIMLLLFLFHELNFFFRRPMGKGGYIMVSGSFVGLVTWSAALIFGPTALWASLLMGFVNLVRFVAKLKFKLPRTRWLADIGMTVGGETFAPLAGLSVFTWLGGRHPLPGLTSGDLWPAIVATLVYVGCTVLIFLPPILSSSGGQNLHTFLRMLLFANGFGMATMPFAILAAGLYTSLGLGIYLALLAGGWLANLLAYQFSQILNSLEERALELTVLEELGREIIAAPPEVAALPQLLDDHVPRLTGGKPIAVWLAEDGPLYHHDRTGRLDLEQVTAVWEQHLTTDPDFNYLLEESKEDQCLLLPIRGENGRLSGGIYAAVGQAQLPALQSLAAQIASAVHRAETYEQRIASEKMARELEIAGKIQATFLPTAQPQLPGWEITATLIPARQTSGDFYDFVELDNGRIGFVVADVADKGTGAALYMALSRTLLRTYAMQFPTEPARALQAVNERILADTHSDQFVTVFCAVLDAASGRLTYANAGHNPALLVGTQAAQLTITGIPLGMFPGQSWQQREVSLQPGDTLILYTDGVTEAMNGRQEEFGDQRLQQLADDHAGQPAAQMQAAIRQAVQTFAGDEPQADDITLLLVKRNPG
jgi:serine phosphatase RsbU (regulator of sigma subunit)